MAAMLDSTAPRLSPVGPLLLAAIVMFSGLGGPRLWDRDEPRNAGCAAEMLERGDWGTPVFNGQLRSHKPVLLYWAMMPGYLLGGVNEFTARLPSALSAVGACWLTWLIGLRLFGPAVARLAPITLCTSMMFVVAGRAATPDSLLILLTTAATAVFVCWAFPSLPTNLEGEATEHTAGTTRAEARRWDDKPWSERALPLRVAVPMYALMGVAMLAKGPVGMILPTAVIGMFLLLTRLPRRADSTLSARPASWWSRALTASVVRSFSPGHFLRTCLWMRPLTAIGCGLAVALPWYVWVGVRTDGAWLEGFFLEHNLGRAMRPMESHGGGVWFYPLALLVGFFPWSIFAAPSFLDALRSQGRARVAVVFCACWIGVYVGLFTIARTKLPSYVTPCYPALALLTARQLDRWRRHVTCFSPRWTRAGLAIVGLVGVCVLAGLPVAARQLLPGEEWLGAAGLIPLGVACACWRLHDRRPQMVRAFTAGAVLLVLVSFAWLSRHVSGRQEFDQLLATMHRHSDHPSIATYECMEPSWVFYAKQPIRRLWFTDRRTPDELAAERSRPRWSPDPAREDFEQFVAGQDAYVLITRPQYEEIRTWLDDDIVVVDQAPLFLKRTDLLLLGRASRSPSALASHSSDLAHHAHRPRMGDNR
ncbi:MAG: glycosyltransferase family 39 protein [Planctomycetales bacterium]|nr:glycosyltransferase family 39 protein [Planctomycetales bacterium]